MSRQISFYADDEGQSAVVDFLSELSVKERAKCYAYISLLEQYGHRLTSQFIKHLEGDLWELRPEFGGVEMRLLYFTWIGDMIVIVHAFKKKSQKMRQRDLKLAIKRIVEVKDGKTGLLQIITG